MSSLILEPSVLLHPNIPRPLHGMAPREIWGKSKWDRLRKIVYAEQDFRCISCGVHKQDAKYHNWIECHEYYNIDYAKGSMEMEKLIGLCHSCHAYCHSGRTLMMYQQGKIGFNRANHIMRHGFKVLKDAGLDPWYGHVNAFMGILGTKGVDITKDMMLRYNQLKEDQEIPYVNPDWSAWHLILEGEKHYGKFKNIQEWENHYT